jgi:hypothetical protein
LPIDCAKPHNGEFVGLYTSPEGPYPGNDTVENRAYDACKTKVARFLGMTMSSFKNHEEYGWEYRGGNAPATWALGDRVAHCYLITAPDHTVTGSLEAP